jgi:hypothetical protein
MPRASLLPSLVLLAALPLAAGAQTTGTAAAPDAASGGSTPASVTATAVTYGPRAGDHEFTLGGNGASNRSLDSSLGGATASLGTYFTDAGEGLIRQSLSYSNPSGNGGNAWNGQTSLAYDQHLITVGPLRPFLGVNLGYTYGNTVRHTWDAGLEGGAKYYVLPRTFLYGMVDYGWFFRHDKAIASRFDTGEWTWSLGMGFDF